MFSWFKAVFQIGKNPCNCAEEKMKLQARLKLLEMTLGIREEESEGCRLEIYQDKAKEFRWRLKSKNHRIIAVSGEGYTRMENLNNALNKLRQVINTVEEVRLESD